MSAESAAPAEEQPHLLYVAWAYPPAQRAGMYRALATANAFVRAGWTVTVLTATRETFERITGVDTATEESIDPRIEIVRIPFDPPRGERDLSRWSRLRVYSPLLWNALRWARALVDFPELAYATWRKPLTRAAEEIHARKPVSLTIGSANPNVDFVPGDVLFRKHGVPYVLDHRDAWHLNVYTGERVGRARSRSARLEARLIAGAVETWFVNEPIRDWHARSHPARADSFHVVSNGFDPEFVHVTRTHRPDPDHLVIGYLGTIFGPIPLRETLEGWRAARAVSPMVRNATLVFRGRLGHNTDPDPETARLLEEFAGDGIRYDGPVSKTQVSAAYENFDALLLIISHSRYVTSGKVYEYAATGLPIASLHHPETAATSVLTGHPAWVAADEVSADAFARALIAVAERAAEMDPDDYQAARAWAAHLARDEQLVPRIHALRRAIGGAE